MIRFNNTNIPKNKKLLIYISDYIREIFGGDRLGRISKTIIEMSKNISKENIKKNRNIGFWVRLYGDL